MTLLSTKLARKKWLAPLLFLLPATIGLLAFKIYPIILAFWDSLYFVSYNSGEAVREFVGFENYQFLLEDFVFWRSVEATAWMTVLINPIQIGCAFGLAMLLQRQSRYIKLFRTLFLIPIGLALPIATIMWGLMFDPNQGLINGMLQTLGFEAQPFLTSQKQALWVIIFIATWKGVSFWMLFLLGGLQDIPKQLYEAVTIDGANWFQKLRYVTLPMLKRTFLFVFVADTTANFVLVVPMILLTQGGPRQSTNVLMYEAYRSGFNFQDFGRSMAIITILTAITLIVIAIQVLFLGEKKGAK